MTFDNPLIGDLAIPLARYPHIREDNSLHDAVEVINAHTYGTNDRIRYDEILVLNNRNELSGIVTLTDILQCLHPRLKEASKVKKFEGKTSEFQDLTILWEDSFFVECTKRSSIPVRDFMSPIRQIVRGSDPALKGLAIMLKTKSAILPVVEEKRVIGVIRLKELFKAITAKCRI